MDSAKTSAIAPTTPLSASDRGLQPRDLAYKLAYLSRTKIEQEACKIEPQLNKLIGHATLLDLTKDFITAECDYGQEAEADEPEFLVDDWYDKQEARRQDSEEFENSTIGEYHFSRSSSEHISSGIQFSRSHETTEYMLAAPGSIVETKEVDPDDWESGSGSSTESGSCDQDSENGWSDSTYEEDQEDDAHGIEESSYHIGLWAK